MLTSAGRVVAVASVALFLAGWLLGYDELLALAVAGALVLGLGAFVVARRVPLDVARTVHPDRVTVGEAARATLRVTNPSARPSAPRVAVETFGSARLVVPVDRLAPSASTEVSYDLPTDRRGVVEVGPLVLRLADPFGLVATTQDVGQRQRLWVHPRVHVVRALPSGRARDLDGPTSDRAPEGGMAFHTLREYVPGDDRRQIHWRSTARTGTLMVRHMVDTSHPVTTVVLDTRPGTDVGAFELAVEAAASIALSNRGENFEVRLRTTGGADLGGVGRAGASAAQLDSLAEVAPEPDGPETLGTVARALEGGGALVLVSGRLAVGDVPAVTRMGRGFDRTVVVRCTTGSGEAGGDGPGPGWSVPRATVLDVGDAAEFVRSWDQVVGRRQSRVRL